MGLRVCVIVLFFFPNMCKIWMGGPEHQAKIGSTWAKLKSSAIVGKEFSDCKYSNWFLGKLLQNSLGKKDALIANIMDALEWTEFLQQLPHFLKQSSYWPYRYPYTCSETQPDCKCRLISLLYLSFYFFTHEQCIVLKQMKMFWGR